MAEVMIMNKEIIKFILREIDRNGNPYNAISKFKIDQEEYNEILNIMTKDKYIISNKIDMAGSILPEYAAITRKGYDLLRK